MDFPELYEQGTIDFSGFGQPLFDAYNIAIVKRVSGAWMISFNMPVPLRPQIKIGAVVKADGQLYIIRSVGGSIGDGAPQTAIGGLHIFWELCEKRHLPRTMWIGLPAPEILAAAFADLGFGANSLRQLEAGELSALGMAPVTERTDVYRDRVNPLEVAARVRDHVGGEFYVDNFEFALVRRQGQDTGQVFNLNLQASAIERDIDDSATITRLIPYGRGNLEITSVAGVNFIDSPHIGDNPEFPDGRQGQRDFSDFTHPEELLRAAKWQFSPNNYWRIDRPKISYRFGAVDLWKIDARQKRLNMGDSVRFIDPILGIDELVRVVAMEEYPYEPQRTVYTLGDPPHTAAEVLASVDPANRHFVNQFFNFNLDNILGDIMVELEDLFTRGVVPIWRRIPTDSSGIWNGGGNGG